LERITQKKSWRDSMKINVHMLAFRKKGTVREVEIDDSFKGGNTQELLTEVFKMGQNEKQPQQVCSVSVGDVIEYDFSREYKYFLVTPYGFEPVTQERFDSMTGNQALEAYGFIKPRISECLEK
jgi:hypothetical protein